MDEGQKIGHYTIIRQLGKGGMGEVYLAEDTRLKREVALKVLPESVRNDPERLRRFRTEAKAAAKRSCSSVANMKQLAKSNPVSTTLIAGKMNRIISETEVSMQNTHV